MKVLYPLNDIKRRGIKENVKAKILKHLRSTEESLLVTCANFQLKHPDIRRQANQFSGPSDSPPLCLAHWPSLQNNVVNVVIEVFCLACILLGAEFGS